MENIKSEDTHDLEHISSILERVMEKLSSKIAIAKDDCRQVKADTRAAAKKGLMYGQNR